MASDMTTAFTAEHGQVAVFVAVDHCSAECVGLHAARRGFVFDPFAIGLPANEKGP